MSRTAGSRVGGRSVKLTDHSHNPKDDVEHIDLEEERPELNLEEAELPESAKTLVCELAEDDEEAAEHPFYKLRATVENQRLERLAHYAHSIETLRGSCLPPEAAEGEIEAEMFDPAILKNIYLSEEERWAWMSGDYLLREIAARIAKGDMNGLERIIAAVGEYQTICEQSAHQVALIWTMVACDNLWENNRNRNQVTKAEIKAEAERLMSKIKRSSRGVKWHRLWKTLGLEDIRRAAPGRPKKTGPYISTRR